MLGKFSEKAQKAMAIAESLAFDLGHASVGTEHLLLSFTKIKESKLRMALEKYNVTFDIVKNELISLFGKKETQPFYMEYTLSMKQLLESAVLESKKYNEDKVSMEVLTYSLIKIENSVAAEILLKYGVDVESLKEEVQKNLKRVSELDNVDDLINLNEKMRHRKEIIVPREKEMNLLLDALMRKKKPNAILVGDPGIGKTALVENLAYLIATGDIRDSLKDKVIYELDIASVVAGTKYRGEFEEKLKKIIRKVKDDSRAIIFIDEIHNIIGAGGAEGAIDASNILKPYLARGDFQCIGATTYDEYVKIFEKEKGLERRFQVINMEEPSASDTIDILLKIRKTYEDFHHIEIPEKIIPSIVNLCKNYISDKFFPDKAIDILDCAAVRSKLQGYKEIEEKIVIEVIENLYKVKIIKEKKAERLYQELKENIFGQDETINKIVAHVNTIENGLIDDNRPLAVLLFVGPTGVGKTEIAKLIAKSYFGSIDKLIKIDMQEFSESSSVAKLIGSPPGYVGYDKQSYLVDGVRKNPHTVILLDEVEKAHRDVLDIFLNVFDEGYFIDASKRRVDFRNTIIILTSNLGHGDELFQRKAMGFIEKNISQDEINKAIRKKLRPEFINRLDDIIYFDSLNKEVCETLIKKYLGEYQKRVSSEVSMELTDINNIISSSEVSKYGARAVKREVKKFLQQQISQKISRAKEVTSI